MGCVVGEREEVEVEEEGNGSWMGWAGGGGRSNRVHLEADSLLVLLEATRWMDAGAAPLVFAGSSARGGHRRGRTQGRGEEG